MNGSPAQRNRCGSFKERVARALDRTIFVALLFLIALTAIPYGTVDPWWHAVMECIIFALAALWIIEGLLSGSWFVKNHNLLWPLIALILFAFLQTLPLWGVSTGEMAGVEVRPAISADPFETRLAALRLIALTLAAGLWLRYTSSRSRLRWLIYFVIGVGVASAVFGLWRQAMQGAESISFLPRLTPAAGYGQFLNRNHFALLMEMTLGLALGIVAGGGARRILSLVFLGAAATLWTALVLSVSRGGILGMLCQLAFIGLLFSFVRAPQGSLESPKNLEPTKRRENRRGGLRRVNKPFVLRAALVVFLMAVTLAGVIWIGGEPLLDRLEDVPDEISLEQDQRHKGTERRMIWGATWEMIKANPIVGIGFGGYLAEIPKHHDGSGEFTPYQAHNDYLEIMASGGVIGSALAAWLIFLLIRRARENLRSPDPLRRATCFGALAGLFAVCVHSLVDFGLHIAVNALVFTALVVIAAADNRVEEEA